MTRHEAALDQACYKAAAANATRMVTIKSSLEVPFNSSIGNYSNAYCCHLVNFFLWRNRCFGGRSHRYWHCRSRSNHASATAVPTCIAFAAQRRSLAAPPAGG